MHSPLVIFIFQTQLVPPFSSTLPCHLPNSHPISLSAIVDRPPTLPCHLPNSHPLSLVSLAENRRPQPIGCPIFFPLLPSPGHRCSPSSQQPLPLSRENPLPQISHLLLPFPSPSFSPEAFPQQKRTGPYHIVSASLLNSCGHLNSNSVPFHRNNRGRPQRLLPSTIPPPVTEKQQQNRRSASFNSGSHLHQTQRRPPLSSSSPSTRS